MLDATLETTKIPMKTVGVNTEFVVYGWRFVNEDGTSLYQKTPQAVGTLYSVPDPTKRIAVMQYGYHVSTDTLVALGHGAGFFIERARLSGTLDLGDEVVAGSERTPLWRQDATKLLAAFAADCTERAVRYIAQRGIEPTDKTERYIQLARDFATGAKSEAQMQAATLRNDLTTSAPKGAIEAEQAAIHAGLIFGSGLGCAANALRYAAQAFERAAERDGMAKADAAYTGERLWQIYDLYDRLMTLAPPTYSETWETVAPLLVASAAEGGGSRNA